jgi:hypothetical protein
MSFNVSQVSKHVTLALLLLLVSAVEVFLSGWQDMMYIFWYIELLPLNLNTICIQIIFALAQEIVIWVELINHAFIILIVVFDVKIDPILFVIDVLELSIVNFNGKTTQLFLQLIFNENVVVFKDGVNLSFFGDHGLIPFDLTRVLLNGISSIVRGEHEDLFECGSTVDVGLTTSECLCVLGDESLLEEVN